MKKLKKKPIQNDGAKASDLEMIQRGEPVPMCPTSPASISPETNDPAPTTGELSLQIAVLKSQLAELTRKFNKLVSTNHRLQKDLYVGKP